MDTESEKFHADSIEPRLIALEFIVEQLLPRLILDSPNCREIASQLLQWEKHPPLELKEQDALQAMLGPLLEPLLDAHPDLLS